MKKILTTASLSISSIAFALAQGITVQTTTGNVNTSAISTLIVQFGAIIASLGPIFITLAVLAFFWYLVEFIWKGRDDAEAKKRGLSGMGYAILAIFAMVSVWGLVSFLGSVLNVGQGGVVPFPSLPKPAAQ